jgi:fatty-acyl-CoA synthase
LRAIAAAVPERTTVIEGGAGDDVRRWTYAELLRDAEACARALLSWFRPRERIAVWAHNLPEWVLLEYGAALAGTTFVTVNTSFQPAIVTFVLGQSRATDLLLVPEVRQPSGVACRRDPL